MAECRLLALLLVIVLLGPAAAQTGAASVKAFLADAKFSTFMSLIQSQNLVDAIDAKPYTIFAPTNDAFDKFFATMNIATNESWYLLYLQETFPVGGLLRYHFAPEVLSIADLPHGQSIQTFLKSDSATDKLRITVDKQAAAPSVILRGWESAAIVSSADNKAGSSVVHVVDSVLLPRVFHDPGFYPPTVVDVLTYHSLDMMNWAVEAVGLKDALVGLNKSVTLLAPSNEAMTGALSSMGTTLQDIDKGLLTNLVKYHIADGLGTTSRMIQNGTVFTWLEDRSWNFNRDSNGSLQVVAEKNSASIIIKDSFSGSGCVVHVIDQVLFPLQLGDAGGSEDSSG